MERTRTSHLHISANLLFMNKQIGFLGFQSRVKIKSLLKEGLNLPIYIVFPSHVYHIHYQCSAPLPCFLSNTKY